MDATEKREYLVQSAMICMSLYSSTDTPLSIRIKPRLWLHTQRGERVKD